MNGAVRVAPRMSEQTDESALIRAAQEGDQDAFEQLVRAYDQSVLRLAMNLLRSPEDAHDVYQEAFLRVYRNLNNFRFDCSFHTWLYRIVTNITPRERTVFELRHYQGLRLRRIGEILGTTEEAAKNCLFRATQKMRAALGDFV